MLSIEGIADKKIVLIDDEEELLSLLETVLKKEGFQQIGKASTGRSGIEICKEMKPDVIVLDIMLPDIDGFEVCRQLREFTIAPVLFLSAKSDDIDKLLGLGIGGDDYITKPFSPKEVAFRVKAQLRRNFMRKMVIRMNGSL
jgi:DNA-binding response OmpR family regulator